jgi:acetyl-CoA synthetase
MSGPGLVGTAPTDTERAAFWERARQRVVGLPGGGLNIAVEAVDRHVAGGAGGRVALRCLDTGGGVRTVTYGELKDRTDRFAALLRRLGVRPGESVFGLLGRVPEMHVAALGTMKAGAVFAPLFSAFGPDPIAQRMRIGDARVLVTTAALYRRKVAGLRERLPGLRHVLLVDAGVDGGPADGEGPAGTLPLPALLAGTDPDGVVPATRPEDPALLHFTSGTTGTPKAAVHVHDAVIAHLATAELAFDLSEEDVYWCTADPGWVTGMSYGIVAPLACGVTALVDEGDFDAERWYRTLTDQRVTVLYTAPTAIRMLMRAGEELAAAVDLCRLRLIASVGEPLNAEAVRWGERVLGKAIHDTWWQTETGAIMIGTLADDDVVPGAMGRPLPGVRVTLLRQGEDGRAAVRDGAVEEVTEPETDGEIALRPPWPSMFRGYLHDEARYAQAFAGGWYLTGDLARRDADGRYVFVGRADDVIKTAGHLIGPFEVESALMEHPAVAEAGVIGVPDPVAGEVVKAFVSLRAGHEPSTALRRELIGFARKRLGAAVAPRDIAFDDALPHTKSGKIMRRLLKARELGLPTGDLSTLERGGRDGP